MALNEKGHLAWPGDRQVLWLSQQLVVPPHLFNYPLEGLCLRLALTWWAEDAQIFVNGELVQQGDLFDCTARVLLSSAVKVGEEFLVVLRLVSPGHDRGALMRSRCIYEGVNSPDQDPGLIADELEVLQITLQKKFPCLPEVILQESPEFVNPNQPEFDLDLNLDLIDWSALPDRSKFEQSLFKFRHNLLEKLGLKPKQDVLMAASQTNPSQTEPSSIFGNISLLGHAHLDLAWLWPVRETWDVAQRTFASVLKLQQDFPDLIFCHSTPALYAWIEQHRPDLFAAIQKQVAAGRWEIVGGMWVEPDLNLIAGESMVRQVLYGQRYSQEKFGQFMAVAWLPDTFGFCWQLPQILKGGGVDYFVTQKLRWNDTNQFPYGVFWWQGLDGTQIFSLMSAPIGEGIEPVKMARYADEWEHQTQLKQCLWLPGVGDHGGGPTRDMLEVAKKWQLSPFFPEFKFQKAIDYLSSIQGKSVEKTRENSEQIPESTASSPPDASTHNIPIWKDELYLEFHRGCYTTHAEQKRWNRRCEGWLYQAELFASLATVIADASYPQTALETAWKQVLFNQFHDILPGSAIPEVYADANETWQEAQQAAEAILTDALTALGAQISLPKPPHPEAQAVVVFNPLNWSRTEVVAVPLPAAAEGRAWQICDSTGQRVRSQSSLTGEAPGTATLLFPATHVPSIGYRLYWLYPETLDLPFPASKLAIKPQPTPEIVADDLTLCRKDSNCPENWLLENEFLRVTVDAQSGCLTSVYDKINQRETLSESGGNQLQAFSDSGQYWDAWNIDPDYAKHPLPPPILKQIQWVESGDVRQRLRVVRHLQNSEFCQDYLLDRGSPLLKVETTVHWQERHLLVKAAFELNLAAEVATYEIPCGAIERKTQPQTPQETAKWEVPALQWADLSANGYGVSLLNDCKYGYDASPNQLRLTLLRGSTWPDPEADRGFHQFTYALYPHLGSWQEANTVQRGYELNLPLLVQLLPISDSATPEAIIPATGSFLGLSADNLILMAFKQSENHPNQWIIRCYECTGKVAELDLKSDWEWEILEPLDLLERPLNSPSCRTENPGQFKISPWQITSFAVRPKSPNPA